MTNVALESAPGQGRNGLISAVVLSAGLAVVLATLVTQAALRIDISVTVGGRTITRSTHTRTVAEALTEADIRVKPTDEVSPSLQTRLAKKMHVVVRHPVPVTLVANGQRVSLHSAAATVGDLLSRQDIAVSDSEAVIPKPSTPLRGGLLIQVVRVGHRLVTEPQEIPYHVRTSADLTLPRGEVRVLRLGRTGLKDRVFNVAVADGVVVRKELVVEHIIRSPVDRVIRVGRRARIAAHGLFAGREYLDVVATAYSPFCCTGVQDITSAGLKAGYGVVAVDPTVIPLGSRLYVDGYGYAVAGDIGGHIKGLRIDLGFPTKRDALQYGVHQVRVYFLSDR